MLFLVLVSFMIALGLMIGLLARFARLDDPVSSVSQSPLRSAVRETVFPHQDMTPEEKDHAEVTANIKANAATRESLINAIQVASSSIYKN